MHGIRQALIKLSLDYYSRDITQNHKRNHCENILKITKTTLIMIITISGKPGSGKSTVAKLIAQKISYRFYSVGDLMGEIAKRRGMSLLELSAFAEKTDEIDRELDAMQISLGKKDNFVIDSRLGFHFLPKSRKIFLDVDLEEGAKRIFGTARDDEKENISLKETIKNIKTRIASEKKRYRDYYGIDDFHASSNFDFVLDTTSIPAEEAADRVIKFLKAGSIKQAGN
jgi:CMP/dCMP kinase